MFKFTIQKSFLMSSFVALALMAIAPAWTYNREQPEWLSGNALSRLSQSSLNRYYHNVYSQCGEDGIIEEIFRRLNIEKGFFVEFGAADGIWLSNTRSLWEKGWVGVMIEANLDSFNKLCKTYEGFESMLCLNYFVYDEPKGTPFDKIAGTHFPDQEIDFLSIDIDGPDYLILEGLKRRPKVICIETGLHWHPLLKTRIPDEYAVRDLQQPLAVMVGIAESKGYKPVCLTGNLFLIRKDLSDLFSDLPSDHLTIWKDGWRSTYCRDHLLRMRSEHPIIRQFEDADQTLLQMPIFDDF